jgi:membrane-associated phospholipid phosphatase
LSQSNGDNSGPFSAMRRHYIETKQDHRPIPVVFPAAIVAILALGGYFMLDARAAAMRGNWPGWILQPARHLTDLGKSGWIVCVLIAIILAGIAINLLTAQQRLRRLAAKAIAMASYVLVTVAIAGLIANLLKRMIGRPRPELFGDHGLFSFNFLVGDVAFESFPSGHATTAGALWTSLALLFPRLRWPFLAIGAYVALTRVFVGAHFPSDIAAGFGWGMWFAFFVAIMFARHGLIFSHKDGKLTRLS